MKKFLKGFVYAARGLTFCIKERNFRFHLCAIVFVTAFALAFYELSRAEWAVLLLTMGLVPALEAVNTSVEQLADKVTTQNDERILRCKDCAAAAVLIASIAAVAVGIALLGDAQRLAAAWEYLTADITRPIILIAAIAAAVTFVLLPERHKKT